MSEREYYAGVCMFYAYMFFAIAAVMTIGLICQGVMCFRHRRQNKQ